LSPADPEPGMVRIRTEIEIDAPPAAVWDVLTALEAYEQWNPHLPRASGALREGSEIRVRVDPSTAPTGVTITPTVTALEPERTVEWTGSILHPRLFEGVHTFELEPLDGGERTRFVNREALTGLVVPLATVGDVEADYEAMNEALAARVAAERPRSA